MIHPRQPSNMRTVFTLRFAHIGLALVLAASAARAGAPDGTIRIDAAALPPVGRVDERFQSYNLGTSDITGRVGGEPWAKVAAPASGAAPANGSPTAARQQLVDLNDRRLRTLAAALGPTYVRFSGTFANSLYFQDNDAPQESPPPGYRSVLTRAKWREYVDFARSVDAKIVTSFAITSTVRDAMGLWTAVQAKPFVEFTHAIGGRIDAAELFNEPNLPQYGDAPEGYDAAAYARDMAAFRAFAAESAPEMKIVGPGDVVMGNVPMPGSPTAAELMSAEPRPRFDVVSYHFYGAVSDRCAPPDHPTGVRADQALNEEWLARTDRSFLEHKALRDRYAPGAQIWNTETGGAACGGAAWDMTFLDTFRYLDQMGRLAKQGISVIFHQTLVGNRYGLLDEGTYAPRPNYWAALLWRRLMGTTVLDAGPIRPGLHLYAQCLLDRPGVGLLAINLQDSPAKIGLSGPAELYALTAPELQSKTVLLNGQPLALGPGDKLPPITPARLDGNRLTLAPTSVNFIALPFADGANCHGQD